MSGSKAACCVGVGRVDHLKRLPSPGWAGAIVFFTIVAKPLSQS